VNRNEKRVILKFLYKKDTFHFAVLGKPVLPFSSFFLLPILLVLQTSAIMTISSISFFLPSSSD